MKNTMNFKTALIVHFTEDIFLNHFLCNFMQPKTWDKLSFNIDHVYCTVNLSIRLPSIFLNYIIFRSLSLLINFTVQK